jgi:uncharacterized protein
MYHLKPLRLLLIAEFLLLCVLLPGIIIYFVLAKYMFAFLWGATLYAFLVYRRLSPSIYFSDLWRFDQINAENLKIILPRWVLACIGMTVFIYLYDPTRMFGLFQWLPLWAVPLVAIAYTVLSALPQEFIFCSFFFKRYDPLLKTQTVKIMASAIVFAWAHVLFINPVAPPLSFIAGLIFAHTFARTRSLALVTLEHGLYGTWLFMVGLGWYFYHGAVNGS